MMHITIISNVFLLQRSQIVCEQGVWGLRPQAGSQPLHPVQILQRIAVEDLFVILGTLLQRENL